MLRRSLDAFSRRRDVKALRGIDHRAHHAECWLVSIADECPVDFDLVEREGVQTRRRRAPSAEIVERGAEQIALSPTANVMHSSQRRSKKILHTNLWLMPHPNTSQLRRHLSACLRSEQSQLRYRKRSALVSGLGMASVVVQAPKRGFVLPRQPGAVSHLLSASEIDSNEVDRYCRAAGELEAGRRQLSAYAGKAVALLFFQPSTRTRMGFEAATVALGASVIGVDDMAASRSNERSGESLEDCASVVSRFGEVIIVRHHEVGAATRMAAKSVKPVINAGDGWNEHPTQALIDIFALRRGLGTIRGKSIAFGGDPRGRTVRSLAYLLRYEAPREVVFCPPSYYDIPRDVLEIFADVQIRCRLVTDIAYALAECDAVMMAPYDMSDIGEPAGSGYISPRSTPVSHVVTAEKLVRLGSEVLIYHPLPRHDEVDESCDSLPNAMYFEQVRLSKFMRMAVLERFLTER